MRVKSVIEENRPFTRYAVQFEHNGTVWEKFLPRYLNEIQLKNWLNSVIEDTIVRMK